MGAVVIGLAWSLVSAPVPAQEPTYAEVHARAWSKSMNPGKMSSELGGKWRMRKWEVTDGLYYPYGEDYYQSPRPSKCSMDEMVGDARSIRHSWYSGPIHPVERFSQYAMLYMIEYGSGAKASRAVSRFRAYRNFCDRVSFPNSRPGAYDGSTQHVAPVPMRKVGRASTSWHSYWGIADGPGFYSSVVFTAARRQRYVAISALAYGTRYNPSNEMFARPGRSDMPDRDKARRLAKISIGR